MPIGTSLQASNGCDWHMIGLQNYDLLLFTETTFCHGDFYVQLLKTSVDGVPKPFLTIVKKKYGKQLYFICEAQTSL